MIVGADGFPSTIGRILAKHSLNPKQYCLGVRTYFTGITDFHPEQFIELHFLEELLPGYLWIFPMADGLANVGLGMSYEKMQATPKSLSAILKQITFAHPVLSKRFANAEMKGKIEAHGLPLVLIPEEFRVMDSCLQEMPLHSWIHSQVKE